MKILKLKGEEVELVKRIATCSFCGDESVYCVKGSVPLSVQVEVAKTRYGKFLPERVTPEAVVPLFSKPYYKVADYDSGRIVVGTDYQERTDDADICLSCIQQLAKLVK